METLTVKGQTKWLRAPVLAAIALTTVLVVAIAGLTVSRTSSDAKPAQATFTAIPLESISDQGTALHQRIAEAIARMQPRTKPAPPPVCLPCIERRIEATH